MLARRVHCAPAGGATLQRVLCTPPSSPPHPVLVDDVRDDHELAHVRPEVDLGHAANLDRPLEGHLCLVSATRAEQKAERASTSEGPRVRRTRRKGGVAACAAEAAPREPPLLDLPNSQKNYEVLRLGVAAAAERASLRQIDQKKRSGLAWELYCEILVCSSRSPATQPGGAQHASS